MKISEKYRKKSEKYRHLSEKVGKNRKKSGKIGQTKFLCSFLFEAHRKTIFRRNIGRKNRNFCPCLEHIGIWELHMSVILWCSERMSKEERDMNLSACRDLEYACCKCSLLSSLFLFDKTPSSMTRETKIS